MGDHNAKFDRFGQIGFQGVEFHIPYHCHHELHATYGSLATTDRKIFFYGLTNPYTNKQSNMPLYLKGEIIIHEMRLVMMVNNILYTEHFIK